MKAYLRSTEFLDAESSAVQTFASHHSAGMKSPRERAVALFYAVRDGIRYDVYDVPLAAAAMRASSILGTRTGFCVHKSIVYAAALRALGIPSRIAFSDVRNHLCTPRLRALIGGDVFHYHAHTELHLGGRWIRAAPVFNRTLCRLFGVPALEFDGSSDATLQAFDERGERHLDTLRVHGSFADFPYETCISVLKREHPLLFRGRERSTFGDLSREQSVRDHDPHGAPS